MNPLDITPADTIEKRRKQIEKAKAAHLSRQLQTRLQYARLKVDHGWQKQTLNEVENLYFHHYRARMSPQSSQKPEKGSGTTSKQSPSVHAAAASSASIISTPVVSTHRNNEQQNAQPIKALQASAAVAAAGEDEFPLMEVDPPPDQDAPTSTMAVQTTSSVHVPQPILHGPASHVINPPNSQLPAVTQSPSPTKPPQPSLQTSPIPHTRTPPTRAPITLSQPPPLSVAVTPPPSRNIPLTRKPSLPQPTSSSLRSRGPSHPIRPSHSAPTSLPGSSNAALTYDSFWSSHSTSTNYRSSLTGTVSYPNLNKGDTNLALPNLGTGYAFSMDASSTPFSSIPLPKQPILTRKPSVPAPLRQSFSGSTGSG